MLTDNLTIDEIAAVRYKEGHEDGREAIARNLLAEGSTLEFINKITGLDMETIQKIKESVNS